MKWPANLLVLVLLAGCATPGQDYRVSGWVYDQPSESIAAQAELVRLSPEVLGRLAAADTRVVQGNPGLDRQLGDYEYRIGPKDILTFTVWDHPELTIPAGEFRAPEIQGHLVSRDGDVFFPYIGSVAVAGKTLVEIRAEITRRLSRYIQNPQLDVRVASFRSQKVNVLGEVETPGFFPITDIPVTLVEAINLAGGARPEGALQQVRLLRDGENRVYDVLALLERGDLSQNALLRDGDVVYVPDNSFFSVHALGSVAEPGVVPMRNGRLNLAEAISLSGGFDEDVADAKRVFVFRYAADKPEVYWLDAGSPDAMLLATQFSLDPQDVVFVASTSLARWNRVVSLILPTVQTLWQTQSFIDRLDE